MAPTPTGPHLVARPVRTRQAPQGRLERHDASLPYSASTAASMRDPSVTPSESTSTTVRRHASAFVRQWPEPARAPAPHPDPEVPATPVELADLELAALLLADPPRPVLSAARHAIQAGWRWTAAYACGRALGRPEVVSESLVLRAALGADRAVGVWRRTGGSGTWLFDAAWRWSPAGAHRIAAGELAWWLKSGATSTENPKTRGSTDTR